MEDCLFCMIAEGKIPSKKPEKTEKGLFALPSRKQKGPFFLPGTLSCTCLLYTSGGVLGIVLGYIVSMAANRILPMISSDIDVTVSPSFNSCLLYTSRCV